MVFADKVRSYRSHVYPSAMLLLFVGRITQRYPP